MRISKISELSGGSFELFLLIKEIQTKTARNGSTFLTFIFTDGSENLSANMWDTSADALEVSAKEIAYVTLEGKPYNGKMSYTVERIRPSYPSEGISLTDFIPCSQIPPETLYDFCLSKIEKMADTELSALVKEIYLDNKDKLLWQSAAKSVHHNKVGELLWHVARMVKMAGASADTYGVLNRDMLLAGVLLHDIGKVSTFTLDGHGQGHFYGHAEKSAEMANAILLRLKAPTALREDVKFLIEKHMTPLAPDKKLLRRRLSQYGENRLRMLLRLQKADFCAKGVTGDTADFAAVEGVLEEIFSENACLSIKDLAVNGHDLMTLGYTGPAIGQALQFLLDGVLDDRLPNEKAALTNALKKQ